MLMKGVQRRILTASKACFSPLNATKSNYVHKNGHFCSNNAPEVWPLCRGTFCVFSFHRVQA